MPDKIKGKYKLYHVPSLISTPPRPSASGEKRGFRKERAHKINYEV
jgi:hypothetical protein